MNTYATVPRLLSALATCAAVLVTTGCVALSGFAPSMHWAGEEPLSRTKVEVPRYGAVASLPNLTVADVVHALDLPEPTSSTGQTARGEGWQASVFQSDFTTQVRYVGTCKPGGAPDAEEATDIAQAELTRLSVVPDDYAWFTLPKSNDNVLVVAEPKIEGVQTWATGIIAVTVDARGVCAFNAVLMDFEPTGGSTDWVSSREAFNDARHGTRPIPGDYTSAEQTWTLASEGALVPVWRFSAADHAIVVVDLGDGLEAAADTETALRRPRPENG